MALVTYHGNKMQIYVTCVLTGSKFSPTLRLSHRQFYAAVGQWTSLIGRAQINYYSLVNIIINCAAAPSRMNSTNNQLLLLDNGSSSILEHMYTHVIYSTNPSIYFAISTNPSIPHHTLCVWMSKLTFCQHIVRRSCRSSLL